MLFEMSSRKYRTICIAFVVFLMINAIIMLNGYYGVNFEDANVRNRNTGRQDSRFLS